MRKQIGCWIALSVLLISSAAYSAPNIDADTLQSQLFMSLLFDDDAQNARLGARAIRMIYPTDESLIDVIAEKLAQGTKTEPRGQLAATVEWYVALFDELKNPRYRDVLTQVRSRTTNKGLLKRIDAALKNMGNAEVAQYVEGTVELAAKKTATMHALAAMRQSSHDQFSQVKPQLSLREVLITLGSPDDTTAWTSRAQKLLLHYSGQGLFVLTVDHDTSPKWIVAAVYPELFPVAPLYSGENFGIAQTLGSFNGRFLIAYLKAEARQISQDTGAQTILAKRLELLPFPDDDYDETALKRGLHWLARSKDPQAFAILQNAVATAKSDKARALAQEALSNAEARKAAIAAKENSNEAEPPDEEDDEPALEAADGPSQAHTIRRAHGD